MRSLSVTNLQDFFQAIYPQHPQPFRRFAHARRDPQSGTLRRKLDVEGVGAQTRFSKKHEHVNPKQDHWLTANRASPFLRFRFAKNAFSSPHPRVPRRTKKLPKPAPKSTGKNRSNFAPRKRPLQYPRTARRHASNQNRRSKGESIAYKKILSKFLLQFHTPTCDDQVVV